MVRLAPGVCRPTPLHCRYIAVTLPETLLPTPLHCRCIAGDSAPDTRLHYIRLQAPRTVTGSITYGYRFHFIRLQAPRHAVTGATTYGHRLHLAAPDAFMARRLRALCAAVAAEPRAPPRSAEGGSFAARVAPADALDLPMVSSSESAALTHLASGRPVDLRAVVGR